MKNQTSDNLLILCEKGQSSNLHTAVYDAQDSTLYVSFNYSPDSVYCYPSDIDTYNALLCSESIGKAFNALVDKTNFTKLNDISLKDLVSC